MEITGEEKCIYASTGYISTIYFMTDYLSSTAKRMAWDAKDIFKVLALHGKLKRMEIIWLFTPQLRLPLVSEFYAVGLLTFYVSDSTLLFGEEEILFLRGESELG